MTRKPIDPHIARLIDANANRAREAVRVMEDYARFVLDDRAGCWAMKSFRHDLSQTLRAIPEEILLSARDTPGDVGTTLETETETQRRDARAVFVAAVKRLPEALRTIEEYGKTIDAEFSRSVEKLRYRAYDLEQRLICRSHRSSSFGRVYLYVIITESFSRGDWLDGARQAIEGGATCIQLREKSLEDAEFLRRGRALAALCRERQVLFIMNDRPDLALLSGADGVHLGQTDMRPADARRIIGPERLIGVSTHNSEQLAAAIADEPDYIAVGPMFDSATKPQPHVPGTVLLTEALQSTDIPIVPIGGITPNRARQLRDQGAGCVSVCSAVIGSDLPRRAAAEFVDVWNRKETMAVKA